MASPKAVSESAGRTTNGSCEHARLFTCVLRPTRPPVRPGALAQVPVIDLGLPDAEAAAALRAACEEYGFLFRELRRSAGSQDPPFLACVYGSMQA